jgi:SsrA-binding protein
MSIKVIAFNKKAKFDYELLETFEAGIELIGPEVKSIKVGHISIKEAFVHIKDNQAWLVNAHVTPYGPASYNNRDPKETRRLLLKRSELEHLTSKSQASGLTIVPVKIYLSRGLVKLEIALARGKKLHQKKEALKQKDIERDAQREIKNWQ